MGRPQFTRIQPLYLYQEDLETTYRVFLDSLNSMEQLVSGSGGITHFNTYINLSTGTTTDSKAELRKRVYISGNGESYSLAQMTWDKQRRMKTKIKVAQNTNQNVYVGLGDPSGQFAGFYITGSIYGQTNTSVIDITRVDCGSIPSLTDPFTLECVFDPENSQCLFYVDGEYKNKSESNLPSGITNADIMMEFYIKNVAAEDKILNFAEYKFWQKA